MANNRDIIKHKVKRTPKHEAMRYHFYAKVRHRFGFTDTEKVFDHVVNIFKFNKHEIFLRISNRVVCFDVEYRGKAFFVLFDTKRRIPVTAMPMEWKDEMVYKHRNSYQSVYKMKECNYEEIVDFGDAEFCMGL